MREIYRNPTFYYVLVPVLVTVWPLLVWGMYLPEARQGWERDQKSYEAAQTHILEILDKEPDILDEAKATQKLGKFTYFEAVDRAANYCGIPSGNLDLSTGKPVKSGKKETQQARVQLTNINIVQGAKFLSRIQSMWVKLTCDRVKLSKNEGMPDQWDMDITFKYDF